VFKIYADLTKLGIVIFVLLTGLAGYMLSFPVEHAFNSQHLINFVLGLFFLSSGSLALNQVQEYKLDMKMPRTAKRPIPSGKIRPAAAFILSVSYLFSGLVLLYTVSPLSYELGFATVVLYNGLYTYWWKPKMIFGAVPGAIPGALPVTIGYAANTDHIWASDSVYLFLILFLWQMPHFWALAIKYRDDYKSGSIPTLPVAIGVDRTLYHTGLYTFAFVLVAVSAPFFVHANWAYLALTLPVSAKVMIEFWRFYSSNGNTRWLAFFLWLNGAMLIFSFVPVVDKWLSLFV
jgi:protoheme IX farnesyltransferase